MRKKLFLLLGLLCLLVLSSCGFNASEEFDKILVSLTKGEALEKIQSMVEKYNVSFYSEIEKLDRSYQNKRNQLDRKEENLEAKLEKVSSWSEFEKVASEGEKLEEEMDRARDKYNADIDALYEYRINNLSTEFENYITRFLDAEDSWNALSWGDDYFSIDVPVIYKAGSEEVTRSLSRSEIEGRYVDIESDIYGYLSDSVIIKDVSNESGESISSLDSYPLSVPFGNAFDVNISIPVSYSYNGIGGDSEVHTYEAELSDLIDIPSPDDEGYIILGYSTESGYSSDSELYNSDNPASALDLLDKTLYAQYVSFDTDYIIQDLNGDKNGKLNYGETVNFYPLIMNTGTISADLKVSVECLSEEAKLEKIGSPDSYENYVYSSRMLIAAGEDSSVVRSRDNINDSYFERNMPDNRYQISVPVTEDIEAVDVLVKVSAGEYTSQKVVSIPVAKSGFDAEIVSYKIHDEANEDGVINPGESITLDVLWKLKDGSDSAYNLTSIMSSSDEGIQINTGRASYASIEEGKYVSLYGSSSSENNGTRYLNAEGKGRYKFTVGSSTEPKNITLTFTLSTPLGASSSDSITLPVKYTDANIVLEKFDFLETDGDGDKTINPGETIRVGYLFKNTGKSALKNPKITFTTETKGVQILSQATRSGDYWNSGRRVSTYYFNSSADTTNTSKERGIEIKVSPDYEAGTPIVIKWTATGIGCPEGGWSGEIELPVVSVRSNPVITRYQIFDPDENNDGIASPGETVSLDFALRNSGEARIRNLAWTLSTDSEYIDIPNKGPFKYNSEIRAGYYLLAAKGRTTSSSPSSLSSSSNMKIEVKDDAPENTVAHVKVSMSDGINVWERTIPVVIRKPDSKLSVEKSVLIDSINGNGICEIGEVAYLDFAVLNSGKSSVSVKATLESNTDGVIVTRSSYDYGTISGNNIKTILSGKNQSTELRRVSMSSTLSNKSANCLSFRIANDAEEGKTASLTLTLTNGYDEWKVPISFEIKKPELGLDASIGYYNKDSFEKVYPGKEFAVRIEAENTGVNAINGLKMYTSSESEYASGFEKVWDFETISSGRSRSLRSSDDNRIKISKDAPVGEEVTMVFTFRDNSGLEKSFEKTFTVGPERFDPVILSSKVYGLSAKGEEKLEKGGYAYIDMAVNNIGPLSGNVRVEVRSADSDITVNTPVINIGNVDSGYTFLLSNTSSRYSWQNRNNAVEAMQNGQGAEVRISPDASDGLHKVEILIYDSDNLVHTEEVNILIR